MLKSLGKIQLEKLISYLIYDEDSSEKIFEDYNEKIENSYRKIIARLKFLYEHVDENDNQLFDVLTDFAEDHDNMYFEVGFWTGIKLVKGLESIYEKKQNLNCNQDIQKALSTENSKESILDQLVQLRTSTALEESLRQKIKSQESKTQICEKIKEIDRKGFTSKQWEVIDEVLEENTANAAEYGRMAYQQGLLDMFNFLRELSISV